MKVIYFLFSKIHTSSTILPYNIETIIYIKGKTGINYFNKNVKDQ